jgi:hypothetical protein
MMGINFLDLINKPVFYLQDQQALLIPEKNEIRLPALLPDSWLIPADKIGIRPGRLLEKTGTAPKEWD